MIELAQHDSDGGTAQFEVPFRGSAAEHEYALDAIEILDLVVDHDGVVQGVSDDRQEGIRAFNEKRAPRFTGK